MSTRNITPRKSKKRILSTEDQRLRGKTDKNNESTNKKMKHKRSNITFDEYVKSNKLADSYVKHQEISPIKSNVCFTYLNIICTIAGFKAD